VCDVLTFHGRARCLRRRSSGRGEAGSSSDRSRAGPRQLLLQLDVVGDLRRAMFGLPEEVLWPVVDAKSLARTTAAGPAPTGEAGVWGEHRSAAGRQMALRRFRFAASRVEPSGVLRLVPSDRVHRGPTALPPPEVEQFMSRSFWRCRWSMGRGDTPVTRGLWILMPHPGTTRLIPPTPRRWMRRGTSPCRIQLGHVQYQRFQAAGSSG
jgi:hypothetical protein